MRQTGAILFLSISIDSDIILSWLYYSDVVAKDKIEGILKWLLLVFTLLGSVAWLFIASDGCLYILLYRWLTPFFARESNVLARTLKKMNARCCHSAVIKKLMSWLRTAGPKNYYSMAWFSLSGIVFSDVALVVLTFIVDNYGEEISPLGAGSIASSAYNLLGRLLDAWDTLKEKQQVNRMVEKEFNHHDSIKQVLQLNQNRIITTSRSSCTIKLWNIDSEQCIDRRIVDRIKWVAKRDASHILVGRGSGRTFYIDIFDVSDDKFTPRGGPLHFPFFVIDLGPIINLFPDKEVSDWIAFVEALQETARGARLLRPAKYSENALIGGTRTGKIFIWTMIDRNVQYASVDLLVKYDDDGENKITLVDYLVDGRPLIVTLDCQYGRRLWTVGEVNYDEHSLTLSEYPLPGAHDVTAVKILDANTIVEGAADGHVRKLDLNTNTYTSDSNAHFQAVTSIAFLDDGRILTGSKGGTALIWKSPPPIPPVPPVRLDEVDHNAMEDET